MFERVPVLNFSHSTDYLQNWLFTILVLPDLADNQEFTVVSFINNFVAVKFNSTE